MYDPIELAWAAGFFDGEGHFHSTKAYPYPRVQIQQTDPEPLERFKAAVQMGSIVGPKIPKNPRSNPVWEFQICGFERFQQCICLLWPYLCGPKRAQAVLKWGRAVELPPIRQKRMPEGYYREDITHCPYGHEYTESNTYTYNNKRSCRICRAKNSRKSYANKQREKSVL